MAVGWDKTMNGMNKTLAFFMMMAVALSTALTSMVYLLDRLDYEALGTEDE